MKKIAVLPSQTLYDLALQHYGTVEAVGELFALNPDLRNEGDQEDFYFDLPVSTGAEITIDEESRLVKKGIAN
ncbi:hypothetical protein EZS27_023765 [termite gut metagenome]|uniref:LysM domain-containing protein n=1 Tax=termite gut metagenome TaxID=433724 RepID=A0A5J4R1X7_9ZZZZ